MPEPWAAGLDELVAELGSDPRAGLATAVATCRSEACPNAIPEPRGVSAVALVLEQLRDPFVLLLLAAGVIAAAVGDLKDTAVIAAVVVVTGLSVATRPESCTSRPSPTRAATERPKATSAVPRRAW